MTLSGGLARQVVSKVADCEGVSEEALPPLYNTIEPDALERLFKNGDTETETELEVQFAYAGYTVLIQEPRDITVETQTVRVDEGAEPASAPPHTDD